MAAVGMAGLVRQGLDRVDAAAQFTRHFGDLAAWKLDMIFDAIDLGALAADAEDEVTH